MADYVHGEMNISEQKKTFDGFIRGGVWLSCVVTVMLIILAFVGI